MINWPNFFIVGEPRTGTTSLYNYLKEIPGIYMSPEKEPHYFSHDLANFKEIVDLLVYPVNPDNFRFKDEKKYLDLFNGVTNEIAIGEASTTYLKHPSTPQRIYGKIPKAKIIIILRDPVDRFISGYYFKFNSGQTKNSLHKVIQERCDEVKRRLQKTNSLSIQVKRYLDTFGKDNVKIIIFEEFIQNTKKTVKEVIKFLGITRPSADFDDKVYNSSKKDSQILTQEDKEKLIDFFYEDVIHLKLILNRDLPWPHFQNKLLNSDKNYLNINNNTKGFFENYPLFYKSDFVNRINTRHYALIQSNKEILQNSSILDIGSNNGKWSFAALKAGARKVIGIEGRQEWVNASIKNMEIYGISKEKYCFINGNIFEEIKKFPPKSFDVVFCFGIFYHIMNHLLLLSEIKKLEPKHLILDTGVFPSEKPIIFIKTEDTRGKLNAITNFSKIDNLELVGFPSKPAINLMLTNLGFSYKYFDWHDVGIKNWEHIEDYNEKIRVSLVATNIDSGSKN